MGSTFVSGVFGSLGCGKSLFCVYTMAYALKYNPKKSYITTNIKLNLVALSQWCGYDVTPYYNFVDLATCDFTFKEGTLRGRKGSVRSVIVFDEIAEFFNQWSSSSPRVKSFLSWLRHSSKKGQEVFIITQEPSFVNKDIRLLCFQWVKCCGYRFIPSPFCYLFWWLPYVYIRRFDNKGNPLLYSGRFVSWKLYGQFYDTAQTISAFVHEAPLNLEKPFKKTYTLFLVLYFLVWALIWWFV